MEASVKRRYDHVLACRVPSVWNCGDRSAHVGQEQIYGRRGVIAVTTAYGMAGVLESVASVAGVAGVLDGVREVRWEAAGGAGGRSRYEVVSR